MGIATAEMRTSRNVTVFWVVVRFVDKVRLLGSFASDVWWESNADKNSHACPEPMV